MLGYQLGREGRCMGHLLAVLLAVLFMLLDAVGEGVESIEG
jgi:hypothetical protein